MAYTYTLSYIYIYIYMCVCVCVYVYVLVYAQDGMDKILLFKIINLSRTFYLFQVLSSG